MRFSAASLEAALDRLWRLLQVLDRERGLGRRCLEATGDPGLHRRHEGVVAEALQLSCDSWTAVIVQPSSEGPAA